jgi:hypothetical protein
VARWAVRPRRRSDEKDVWRIVYPILDARLETRIDPNNRMKEERLGKLLYALYQDHSPLADEAAASLLAIYLGEANDEDLLHDVTVRGKGVLPYLERFEGGLPESRMEKYATLVKSDEDRRRDSSEAERYIRESHVWGTD